MSELLDLTVLVLTLDEERHIRRCIEGACEFASRVVVVDCGSRDRTQAIARALGADVLENPFTTHGRQLNWALAHAGISTTWVMKLDADEYVVRESIPAFRRALIGAGPDIAGFTLRLRRIFLGRWLRHGSLYPIRLLRVWRFGLGRCEERWMDEHVIANGPVTDLDADFADHNLHSVTWWTEKHNRYSSRAALDSIVDAERVVGDSRTLHGEAAAKRWVKHNVYGRMPLGLRAFLYFFYRYFLRAGFLDGWQGFVFHFLQGLWYRTLVDVKIHEVRRAMAREGMSPETAARDVLGIRPPAGPGEEAIEDIGHHRSLESARHDSTSA